MNVKQQQKNWWIDIDGLTYETWEALSRGYQCKWNIKQFEGNRSQICCVIARFQTINTLQLYTEQKTQNKQTKKQQQIT